MTIEEAFGIVIRRLRKDLLLSQEDLSQISSLDRSFISHIERGKQQPTLLTIFELANALNVSVSRIFTEVELLFSFNKVTFYRHDLKPISSEKLLKMYGGKILSALTNISHPGKLILLVEDDLMLLKLMSDLITSNGYHMIVAEDGHDAVVKYKENLGNIDLVLMDIMMPRKDGVTAHEEILQLDAKARILLMSGYSEALLGGIKNVNFIQKPMLPEKLLARISDLLSADMA